MLVAMIHGSVKKRSVIQCFVITASLHLGYDMIVMIFFQVTSSPGI